MNRKERRMSPEESRTGLLLASELAALAAAVAQSRDREAFAAPFRLLCAEIAGLSDAPGSRSGHAEEIAQDALVTLWRKSALFDPAKSSLSTWLYRHCAPIAASICCAGPEYGDRARRSGFLTWSTRPTLKAKWMPHKGNTAVRIAMQTLPEGNCPSCGWPSSRGCRTAKSRNATGGGVAARYC